MGDRYCRILTSLVSIKSSLEGAFGLSVRHLVRVDQIPNLGTDVKFTLLLKSYPGWDGCGYVSELDIRIVFVLSGRPLRLDDINTGIYEGSRPNRDARHEGLYRARIPAHTPRQPSLPFMCRSCWTFTQSTSAMTLSTTLLWVLFNIVTTDWAVSASGLDSVQLDSFSNSSGLWRPQVHFSPPQVCATSAIYCSIFHAGFICSELDERS